MKPTDITKLKHLAQDKISRSANPAVVRNSTVFFKNMQELMKQENLVKSVRGAKGGYVLESPPEEIKISNIISAVDEKIKTFVKRFL